MENNHAILWQRDRTGAALAAFPTLSARLGFGGKSVNAILQKALFSAFVPFQNEVREIILTEFGSNLHTYIAMLEAIATGTEIDKEDSLCYNARRSYAFVSWRGTL